MSEAVVSRLRLPRCLAGEAAAARGRGRRAPPVNARHLRPVLPSDLVPRLMTSAWTRQTRAMSGRPLPAKKKKKKIALTLLHIPSSYGLRSNGPGKGHLAWSGPGCCCAQRPASLSGFNGWL